MFTSLFAKLAHISQSLPSQCTVCRAWGQHLVCIACVDRFTSSTKRCTTCAAPLAGNATRCGMCLQHGSVLDACYAAVDYDYPWDGLLAQLKFNGATRASGVSGANPAIARAIANAMGGHVALVQALHQATWMIPIPLSANRLRERGFNQALQIAKQLLASRAQKSTIQLRTDLLVRTRDTPAQVGLGRSERQRNMLHAFAVEPSLAAQVQGARIVLLDDVTTTTATLSAAAAAMRIAGATHVVGMVFARTPPSRAI
jgi:ComF family protein